MPPADPTWTLARLVIALEAQGGPGTWVWIRGADGLRYPFFLHRDQRGDLVLEPCRGEEWAGAVGGCDAEGPVS